MPRLPKALLAVVRLWCLPVCVFAQGLPGTPFNGTVSTDISTVFTLAEQKYPTLFVGGSAYMSYSGFTYRYFASTGIYVGIKDGSLYLLGGPFGSALTPKMTVAAALSLLQSAPNPPAPANPGEASSLSTLQGVAIDLTGYKATTATYQPIYKVEAKPALKAFYVMSTSLTASTPVFGRSIRKFDYDGNLDTSYGTAGAATLNTADLEQAYSSFAVDSSGRAYVIAHGVISGSEKGAAITRFTASGALDTSFGSAGKLNVGIRNISAKLQALQVRVALVLPDDSLLLAGRALGVLDTTSQPGDNHWVLINLKADGSVNTAFGEAGVAKVVTQANDQPALLTRGGNGDLYMAGKLNDNTSVVYRFNSSGKLDTTYGSNGKATLGTGAKTTFNDLVVDGNGAVYGVGTQSPGTVKQGLVTKLTASGTADSSYGTSGSTVVNFYEIFPGSDTYNDELTNGWFDQQGKLLVGGMAYQTGTKADYLTVARLGANGSVDDTFYDRTDATRFQRITWSSYAMDIDWETPGVRAPVFPNIDGSRVIGIGKQVNSTVYSLVRWR